MHTDDSLKGHGIYSTITDNADAVVMHVTAHLDQCPAQQDTDGKTGANEGNQSDTRACVSGIQCQSQRLNISSHARPVLYQRAGIKGLVHVGRCVLLADHLRVMLLIALNQTLFLLDIGDTHLHSLQKKMDISRCIAAAPDSVQSGDKIIHLP